MTLVTRLGLLKYCYNLGKEYADVLKGTLTPTLLAGYMANQAGATATASTGMALLVPVAMIVVSLGAGWVTWKWRIVHATIGHEWEANPFQRAQIDTLREVAANLNAIRERTYVMWPGPDEYRDLVEMIVENKQMRDRLQQLGEVKNFERYRKEPAHAQSR